MRCCILVNVHSDDEADRSLDGVTWAVRRTEMAIQAVKGQQLRPLGMLAAHFSMLVSVDKEPGLTGAELARRLGVTPQAVASLAAKLEERGQLERRQHPLHRHVQELHLTDAGRAAVRDASDVIAELERRIAGKLTAKELSTLVSLLDRVADAVRED